MTYLFTESVAKLAKIALDTDGNIIKECDKTTPRAQSKSLRTESLANSHAAKMEEQKRCDAILKKRDIYVAPSDIQVDPHIQTEGRPSTNPIAEEGR